MPANVRETQTAARHLPLPEDWFAYCQDSFQRSVLFFDVLRKRGNNYLDHLRAEQPPVLAFDYEMIMDARTFDEPANYALVRIIDRRAESGSDRRKPPPKGPKNTKERRQKTGDQRHRTLTAEQLPEASKRPIIIFDPRAGHGPGIGGSKKDSQIGMAMDAGHPAYFLIFFTRPMPGQTLAHVRNAQIRFVEEVRRRHPKAPRPAIIGNCQGGWAAALVGAKRPDLVGPMAFNGSPLSYWGGVEGVNPMRYAGGLLGGTWASSLLSDLGNGYFDGAHIVANFENLNPANTLWTKQYNLYANIDTEEARYLNFEKWWGGFFLLGEKEMHQIVDGLFIGNKLERGEFEIEEGGHVDLKRNKNHVVVFASFGDNITPPQQAFNWICKTYGTVEEIKRRGQVIAYIDHSEIGHLGIFVSAKIARKEHKGIIASFSMLDNIPPGLYHMRIVGDKKTHGEYTAEYTEKNMDDIWAMDDGTEDEVPFLTVRNLSEMLDLLYRTTLSPAIRSLNNDATAEALRQLHPLRMQRYLISDLNPWIAPVAAWAAPFRNSHRKPASPDNPYCLLEKAFSDATIRTLNLWRDLRDAASEFLFKSIYENPIMEQFAGSPSPEEAPPPPESSDQNEDRRWHAMMEEGGFEEAVVRSLIAVLYADGRVSSKGHETINRIFAKSQRMKEVDTKKMRQMVHEQARIIETDAEQAVNTLPYLLPGKKDRVKTLTILEEVIQGIGQPLTAREKAVLGQIKGLFQN
jgi:pimeloyl-ACP methyl ester carboxylesterase